jgi:hypothetical protein
MSGMRFWYGFALGSLVMAAGVLFAEEPLHVTLCQLSAHPELYNHKLVRVTAFVSHGFEDFGLVDFDCPSSIGVWLEYGGLAKSGTIYCCGVSDERTRPAPLTIEGVLIPLVIDGRFKTFDDIVQSEPAALIHATIAGHFFSGVKTKLPGGTHWIGYGHMGMMSLLTIEQVLDVDRHDRDDRDDVDYGLYPDRPKGSCQSQELLGLLPSSGPLNDQRAAEHNTQPWPFAEPNRVATEALRKVRGLKADEPVELKETARSRGRIVYETPPGAGLSYEVVVSRPYWLTFYAKNPRRVAWVAIGINAFKRCEKE